MKVLVTGGEGFIGRNIIDEAINKNWETISIDVSGRKSHSQEFHNISILNRKDIMKIFKDVDIVFHNAAVTSPPEFEEKPNFGFETNVMGTFNVLEAARENGVKKVILASSSSIYGNSVKTTSEEDLDTEFINFYPMTKYFNEIMANLFGKDSTTETVLLRYFNTYGVGENSKGFYSSVIHKFITDIKNGKRPVIFGDGTQSRDFIFVKDVAQANLMVALRGKSTSSYNVGTGVTTTFNEIFNIIKEEMKSDISPTYSKNPFKSYQMYTKADISKITKEIGFNQILL
ncbi:NAD-dependent epimerase/dehydratase [mine drainage metagenome]|uniref:NAD-dependent epimerase/dehydratase n=1 Tax=mine drainage metagenome TaxID=410659 RepID=T0YE84_9ZZZZ